jgi:hypothetical protein
MSLWRLLPVIGLGVLGIVVIVVGYRAFEAMETLPGYLIEAAGLRITNCDPPHDPGARTTCERLHCRRALIEAGLLPADARVEPGEARREGSNGRVVHVAPLAFEHGEPAGPAYARCILQGYAVERAEVLERAERKSLEGSGGLWDPDVAFDTR